MNIRDFHKLTRKMVDVYGVPSWLVDGEDEDEPWFYCPECNDPVAFEDWKDDEELESGYCPICGTAFFDEEE